MGATTFCSGLLLLLWLWRCVFMRAYGSGRELRHRNIILVGPSIYILKVIRQVQYLWKGPEILLHAHTKELPYAIRTPETYQIQFSSDTHIKQLSQAPEAYLSLHALAKDMFQPEYTMNGLEVDDPKSVNRSVHLRALQVELQSQLPILKQPLADCISTAFAQEVIAGEFLTGNWRSLRLFPTAKRVITAGNARIFFGPEVSNDPAFLEAALEYPEHLMETAEALRFIPSFLAPFAAPYLMRRHKALKMLLTRLTPIVEKRLNRIRQRDNVDEDDPLAPATQPVDCIQFLVNAVERKRQQDVWSAQRIVQVLLGTWFASVHQPAMCLFYALDDLCLHPQYVDELRDEVSRGIHEGRDIDSLTLLDGFLRESARLHPTDSISVRRKVLQPFTFQDGTCLMRDEVACVPLQPILRNPQFYEDPLTFNPRRYAALGKASNIAKFTLADHTFPIWGLGKHACPGRYYASLLLKLVLTQILLDYEVRMPDNSPQRKRYFYWRSSIVPKSGARLEFRKRSTCE
ncbi:cytochrome P450 [Aspergillus leporis]|uniref:Cytochrome P450 n=1 Tax=Aspergillus leporis TaxID=41062 RepID=A0A5N5X4F7_9EURO|nr:cytochrome P450 [Aspergillus leporis]